jgi:hypothetical protein
LPRIASLARHGKKTWYSTAGFEMTAPSDSACFSSLFLSMVARSVVGDLRQQSLLVNGLVGGCFSRTCQPFTGVCRENGATRNRVAERNTCEPRSQTASDCDPGELTAVF